MYDWTISFHNWKKFNFFSEFFLNFFWIFFWIFSEFFLNFFLNIFWIFSFCDFGWWKLSQSRGEVPGMEWCTLGPKRWTWPFGVTRCTFVQRHWWTVSSACFFNFPARKKFWTNTYLYKMQMKTCFGHVFWSQSFLFIFFTSFSIFFHFEQ